MTITVLPRSRRRRSGWVRSIFCAEAAHAHGTGAEQPVQQLSSAVLLRAASIFCAAPLFVRALSWARAWLLPRRTCSPPLRPRLLTPAKQIPLLSWRALATAGAHGLADRFDVVHAAGRVCAGRRRSVAAEGAATRNHGLLRCSFVWPLRDCQQKRLRSCNLVH